MQDSNFTKIFAKQSKLNDGTYGRKITFNYKGASYTIIIKTDGSVITNPTIENKPWFGFGFDYDSKNNILRVGKFFCGAILSGISIRKEFVSSFSMLSYSKTHKFYENDSQYHGNFSLFFDTRNGKGEYIKNNKEIYEVNMQNNFVIEEQSNPFTKPYECENYTIKTYLGSGVNVYDCLKIIKKLKQFIQIKYNDERAFLNESSQNIIIDDYDDNDLINVVFFTDHVGSYCNAKVGKNKTVISTGLDISYPYKKNGKPILKLNYLPIPTDQKSYTSEIEMGACAYYTLFFIIQKIATKHNIKDYHSQKVNEYKENKLANLTYNLFDAFNYYLYELRKKGIYVDEAINSAGTPIQFNLKEPSCYLLGTIDITNSDEINKPKLFEATNTKLAINVNGNIASRQI